MTSMIKPRLDVLFKDNLVMVVNKLPGMLSQGGKHSVCRVFAALCTY